MPSWPTRLFSNSAAATTSSPSTLSRPDNEPATPVRNPPIQAPSSSVPRTTSHHGRSISHPFPSIFGSGKKKSARDEDEEVVDAKVETTGMSISPAAGITSRIHTVRAIASACSSLSMLRKVTGRCFGYLHSISTCWPYTCLSCQANSGSVKRTAHLVKGNVLHATPMYGGHNS